MHMRLSIADLRPAILATLAFTALGAARATGQQADSWSNNAADVLNDRIAEGVIAANVTQPPTDYQTRIQNLASGLDSTCD